MTKDVMIAIRGLQFLEGDEEDNIETLQQGEFFLRNGSRYLVFDEYQEGFQEPVKTTLKYKDGEMVLTRRGVLNVQMVFAEGRKNTTRYQTPYGVMMIGIDTSRVVFSEDEHGFKLDVNYTLEANYQYVADCHIRIEVREKGSEPFNLVGER